MDKIRSIAYSFDLKSVDRRHVGKTLDVRVGDKTAPLTICDIECDETQSFPVFHIYVVNKNNEEARWKSVSCINMQVEYDLTDLLETDE